MLTWDETRETVQKAQLTKPDEFEAHLANYVVQGVLPKLIDDYVDITMKRALEGNDMDFPQLEALTEAVAYEASVFMVGVQVGWFMAEELSVQNNGWQRALDIQLDLLKWHQSEFGGVFTKNFFGNILEKDRGLEHDDGLVITPEMITKDVHTLERNVRQHLWRADTMYVTTDMEHIALQAGHDLPDDYRWNVHELLCPLGFCMLEETIYGVDRTGINMGVTALSWYEMLRNDERVVVIMFWSGTYDGRDESTWHYVKDLQRDGIPVPPLSLCHYYVLQDGATVRPGKEMGSPQGSELVDGILSIFAAINILAHQTIGEPIKLPLDRATRRRYARDFTNAPERMITLITLRRKSAKQAVDPDAPPVPWSRRWIVRGHWRRQPIKTGWKWKYIYEYVKGPEDKPLIITERRVFNFRR